MNEEALAHWRAVAGGRGKNI